MLDTDTITYLYGSDNEDNPRIAKFTSPAEVGLFFNILTTTPNIVFAEWIDRDGVTVQCFDR